MRQVERIGVVGLSAALLVTWGIGCGDTPPPAVTGSDTKATVSGTVSVNGKKLSKGQVSFDPSNVNRKTAPVGTSKVEAGSYKVETLIGPNSITVNSPEMKRSGGTFLDVKEGSNDFNIDLTIPR